MNAGGFDDVSEENSYEFSNEQRRDWVRYGMSTY
jgi:hypothetical protein